jgi:hypothetical protein
MWVVTENYQLLDHCNDESLHIYEIAEKTPTTIPIVSVPAAK